MDRPFKPKADTDVPWKELNLRMEVINFMNQCAPSAYVGPGYEEFFAYFFNFPFQVFVT